MEGAGAIDESKPAEALGWGTSRERGGFRRRCVGWSAVNYAHTLTHDKRLPGERVLIQDVAEGVLIRFGEMWRQP